MNHDIDALALATMGRLSLPILQETYPEWTSQERSRISGFRMTIAKWRNGCGGVAWSLGLSVSKSNLIAAGGHGLDPNRKNYIIRYFCDFGGPLSIDVRLESKQTKWPWLSDLPMLPQIVRNPERLALLPKSERNEKHGRFFLVSRVIIVPVI